ncbi:hypothetical protein [Billgrantia gudaonensis]|uniref:Phage-related minor tail protein n=1 Tax=Billgrantia gudaonensis TaxID=376427 RepID=A0A1G8XEH5_9GAMM|nr:hypothetical protein [Halomonas gudaonensis]SDJ88355.1 Phage-related minor tail protein [Halomonas gudaonensis]
MAKDLNLSVTLSAINKATGPLKQILKGSRGAGRAIRDTRDELRDLNGQQKKITAFRDTSREAHAARRALMDKREELKQVTHQLETTQGPTRRLTQQQAKARREIKKLAGRYGVLKDRARELENQLPKNVRATGNLDSQQEALARQIEATNRRLERQQGALKRLGQADVGGKFRNMTGEVRRFGRNLTLAGTIAAGSIFGLANSTATLGDDVAKTADAMGIGIGQLQELRYSAERSGVSTQKLDSSMERFVKRLGEAKQGGGAAAKAYEQLGMNASELARLTPDEALATVANRLRDVESQTDRVAVAAQLFGREGVAMVNMLKGGSSGLEQLRNDARATGYVLGDQAARDAETFKDALLDAELGMKGMKNTVGAELMPAITELMRDLSGWMRENRDQVKAFAAEFGERLKAAVPVIVDLASGVGEFARTLTGMITTAAELAGGFDNLAMIIGGLFAAKAITSVVAFGASLVKAGAALGTLASTLPGLIGGIKTLGLAFMATPLGWVIGAVTAIGAGAIYLWRNWETIGPKFSALWEGIKTKASAAWDWLKGLMEWSPIATIRNAWTGLGELGASLIDGLIGGIDEKWQALKDKVTGIASGVTGWFKEKLGINSPSTVFAGFGGNLLDGLIDGIDEKWQTLKDAIGNTAGAVTGWFKEKLGIRSPSRVFAELGGHTMAGYQQGLAKSERGPLREVDAFAKRLRQAGAGLALGAAAGVAVASPGGPDAGGNGGIAIDRRPPMAAPAGGGLVIQGGINIEIHATPGMNEQALAGYVRAEVQRALAEAERDARARQRSALYDTD